jgi:transcriptional regulator with XRE-family HTH domain
MKKNVKDRITELISETGLNKTEFAAKLNMSPVTIYKIENGENNPSNKTLRTICNTFKVNYKWLTDGDGEMFIDGKLEIVDQSNASSPWKDALVLELKEEVKYLREMLKISLSSKKETGANFPNVFELAGAPLLKGTSSGTIAA